MQRMFGREMNMSRILAVAFFVALIGYSSPAAAGEPGLATTEPVTSSALPPLAADTDWSLPPVRVGDPKRGTLLPMLYVGLGGLNAFDAYSTRKGLASGAVEANPFMKSAAGNSAAMWTVKAGVTAGTIAVAERLWRQDRKVAAITTMVISNAIVATVAAHNARILAK